MAALKPLTHGINIGYSDDAGTVTNHVASYTGDSEVNENIVVPAGAVDLHVGVTFDIAGMQSCVVDSDVDLSIAVNAPGSGAPSYTIALKAGVAKIFTVDGAFGGANPWAANVTAGLYLTNAAITPANLKIRVLAQN